MNNNPNLMSFMLYFLKRQLSKFTESFLKLREKTAEALVVKDPTGLIDLII